MKAKSWKTFIDKDPEQSDNTSPFESVNNLPNNPLDSILAENETLRKLVEERELLEKKMSDITGNSIGGFADKFSRNLGEIPSQFEKKKQDEAWADSKAKVLDSLKQRKNSADLSSFAGSELAEIGSSNLTPLSPSIPEPNFAEKLLAKKKEDLISKLDKPKKKEDDWEAKKEKRLAALKKAKKAGKNALGSFRQLQGELDRFSEMGKGGSGDEDGFDTNSEMGSSLAKAKEKIGKGSKLDDKLNKITETFNKKRGGEKLDQLWGKRKEKKDFMPPIKSPYDERKKRLLNVNRGTLEELDAQRDALKKTFLERKKEEKKAEEKKEAQLEKQKEARKEEGKNEKKREERKRKKNERF